MRATAAATTATPAAAATVADDAPGGPGCSGRPPPDPPWPGCCGAAASAGPWAVEGPGAGTAECTMTRTTRRWPSSQWLGAPLMKQKKPGRSRRNVVAPSAKAATGSVELQASKAARSTSSTESLAYLKSANGRINHHTNTTLMMNSRQSQTWNVRARTNRAMPLLLTELVADVEAVLHGPPAVAGVGVGDAPPARAADVEHQARRRGRCGRGAGSAQEEDGGEEEEREPDPARHG
jgi:hypothetical protein